MDRHNYLGARVKRMIVRENCKADRGREESARKHGGRDSFPGAFSSQQLERRAERQSASALMRAARAAVCAALCARACQRPRTVSIYLSFLTRISGRSQSDLDDGYSVLESHGRCE